MKPDRARFSASMPRGMDWPSSRAGSGTRSAWESIQREISGPSTMIPTAGRPADLFKSCPAGIMALSFAMAGPACTRCRRGTASFPARWGWSPASAKRPVRVQWHRRPFFVSSWRDHQVQSFTLDPARRFVYRGDHADRCSPAAKISARWAWPFAPDGSLYVTDWASASYSVNGKGRIWKLSLPSGTPLMRQLKPTEAMEHAAASAAIR